MCILKLSVKSDAYLINIFPKAHRLGDGIRDILGELLLVRDVLDQIVHLLDVPETPAGVTNE